MHFYDYSNGTTPEIVNTSITLGGTAQNAFGDAVVPANGYEVQNTSAGDLWVSDSGAAAVDHGIKIVSGTSYISPMLRRPLGALSIFGATTGQKYMASRW